MVVAHVVIILLILLAIIGVPLLVINKDEFGRYLVGIIVIGAILVFIAVNYGGIQIL